MRVSGVSTLNYNRNLSKRNVGKKKSNPEQRQNGSNVNFSGKKGAIVGAVAVAAVGLATGGLGYGLLLSYGLSTSALAAAAPMTAAGAYMGHKAEESGKPQ